MTRTAELRKYTPGRPSVVLLSQHYYQSKRRAGFHALARAYARLGWRVIFATLPVSYLSYVTKDHRLVDLPRAHRNRLAHASDGVGVYVRFTAMHPANAGRKGLNCLTRPLLTYYRHIPFRGLAGPIRTADLIIIESTAALLLTPRIRRAAPSARLVYRVSDDLRRIGVHPAVVEEERSLLSVFDLVSVPSRVLFERYAGCPSAELRPHGVWTDLLQEPRESPYREGIHVCFVGSADLDTEALRVAADALPGWTFHVIGRIAGAPRRPNVRLYGEMAFVDTIPYVQHATVGFQCIARAPYAETRASLKVLQFGYCGVPVVAPQFLPVDVPGTYRYDDRAPSSLVTALRKAAEARSIPRAHVENWSDVAAGLAAAAGLGEVATP